MTIVGRPLATQRRPEAAQAGRKRTHAVGCGGSKEVHWHSVRHDAGALSPVKRTAASGIGRYGRPTGYR